MAMSTRNKRRAAAGAISPILGGLVWFLFGPIGFFAFVLLAVLVFGGVEVLAPPEGDEPKIESRRSFWVGLLLPLGLVLLFISERVVGAGNEMIWLWRALPLTCLAAAVAWRGYALSQAQGNQRKVEIALMSATVGVLVALGIYALSTDAGVEMMGLSDESADRASGALGGLWLVVLVVSVTTLLFMELAYRVMPVEEAIELRRVGAAAGTGLAISLSLVFVASINFVATERDVTKDLSYLKTTRPSEQTLRMAQRVDEPVEIALFYPEVNEVHDRLRPYFDELAAASDQVTVTVRDHALSYEIAQRHRVPRNGFVVLLRGEGEGQQAEQFEVGVELESARSRLRTLDARFQQHFAQLTTRPRSLHMTVGHREHSASPVEGDSAEERLSELEAALTRSNIESERLGVSEGLANEVPEDARAVAVVGPREPFLPEEAQSLLRYVQGGGRLLVFVDPDVDHGLDPLLAGLGLSIPDGVLFSDRRYMRRRTGETDRSAIYSNSYGAHPTVTLANRYRSRVVSVFLRGGAIERNESEAQLEGVNVTFPLRTDAGFWLDADGDRDQGENEAAGRFNMIAAVTVPNEGDGEEGRAVVIADGDFITDQLIGNRGNAFVLMDSVNWLVGEEHVLGPTQTEEDVPIVHTRDEDEIWFYATSFGLPLPLLVVGVWLSRRKWQGRKTKRKPKRQAPTAPREPAPSPAAAPKEEEE